MNQDTEQNQETAAIMRYLIEDRGLFPETLSHFGVVADLQGFRSKGDKDGYDTLPCFALPYIRANDQQPYAHKWITRHKSMKSTPGQTRGFFNERVLGDYKRHLDECDQDPNKVRRPLIITEGEIDCMSIYQSCSVSCQFVVSLPNGWGATNRNLDCFHKHDELLKRAPAILVAGDNDEAGSSLSQAVMQYATYVLGTASVRAVEWPEGCKDANDVLRQHGSPKIAQLVQDAKTIDFRGATIYNEFNFPERPAPEIFRTGLKFLDEVLCFPTGELVTILGVPGAGKSQMAAFLLRTIAGNEQIRCGIFCMETNPTRLRNQFHKMMHGVPFDGADPKLQAEFKIENSKYITYIDVNEEEDDVDLDITWVEDQIRTAAARERCRIIAVDPWNMIQHERESNISETKHCEIVLRKLKRLALKLNICVVIVHHPPKLKERYPLGGDAADSQQFFNKSAMGLTVHFERFNDMGEQPGYAETKGGFATLGASVQPALTRNTPQVEECFLLCWKSRDEEEYGVKKGRHVMLSYDPKTGSYSEEPWEPLSREKRDAPKKY